MAIDTGVIRMTPSFLSGTTWDAATSSVHFGHAAADRRSHDALYDTSWGTSDEGLLRENDAACRAAITPAQALRRECSET